MHVRSRLRVALVGLTVAGGAAVAAVLGAAPAAVGQTSPPLVLQVQVAPTATLVAKGAGIDVTVTTQCSGSVTTPFLQVSITERVGSVVASGFATAQGECTGTSQTVVMRVTASGGKAFKKGTAIALGDFNGCDFNTCDNVQDQHTITIS